MEAEEELRRLAFREYMMAGSGDAKTLGSPEQSRSSAGKSPGTGIGNSKTKREFHSRCQAFHSCVREWRRTDEQLGQLTASIANLRHRIWAVSRALDEQESTVEPSAGENPAQCKLGGCFRSDVASSSPRQLPSEILHLTLDDALLQHEKMLALLRQWLSQLSQEQDALGRRLGGVLVISLRHHAEMEGKMAADAEKCRQIFLSLARDLYRKQEMAQGLWDSCTDHILFGSSRNDSEDSPRKKAQLCSKDWFSSSPNA